MRYCEIIQEMSSLYFGLAVFCQKARNLTHNPCPPPQQLWTVQCTLHFEHCVKFCDSSIELAEYIKPKIQRRHLFADLSICEHLRTPLSPIFWTIFYTPEVWLTRGRADPGWSPGLPRGRYPKSGTPHLKPVISVKSMQTPGNRQRH